jgi:outer membrane protein assembly factor BamE (lipoprotein component of BamABCDE complex)
MKQHKGNKTALFVSLAATAVMLVGCVVSDSKLHYTGITDESLKQVQCGKTTKDQLVATFGEPSEQRVTDAGNEILSYKCTRKQDNSVVVFPIVIVDDEKETEHTISFEIKDGIVQRYWKKT